MLKFFKNINKEKQKNVIELIGDKMWNVDLEEGTLTFEGDLTFPVQILRSVSHIDNTWLWIWANKDAQYNEKTLKQANDLKDYGDLHSVYELSAPSFDVHENDWHKIGVTAIGLYDYSFYYRGDYGNGSAIFTIDSVEINKNMKNNPENVLKIFLGLISTFEMNHKNSNLSESNLSIHPTAWFFDNNAQRGARIRHLVRKTFAPRDRFSLCQLVY